MNKVPNTQQLSQQNCDRLNVICDASKNVSVNFTQFSEAVKQETERMMKTFTDKTHGLKE